MPPFLRLNPILDWNYGQVWHFLRTFQLPYCKLYDDGYTSLGTVKDTLPCPALKKDNDEYWPAYMLRDWDQERAGRISK
jgi:FAD synthetase